MGYANGKPKRLLKCLMRRDGYQAELAEMRPQAARNGSLATALR